MLGEPSAGRARRWKRESARKRQRMEGTPTM
jgi:hypothetical protein